MLKAFYTSSLNHKSGISLGLSHTENSLRGLMKFNGLSESDYIVQMTIWYNPKSTRELWVDTDFTVMSKSTGKIIHTKSLKDVKLIMSMD